MTHAEQTVPTGTVAARISTKVRCGEKRATRTTKAAARQ